MIKSHALVYSDFDTSWYKRWAKELKQNKDNLDGFKIKSNKFWQNAVMAQVLYENDLLKDGIKGIGFGVGKERLPALFAKYGVKVTATDQDFNTQKAKHWQKDELATGLHSLNRINICDNNTFKKNVSYLAVDMNKVSKGLHSSFNFVWSNCALGHLGSIETGIQFILNSAKCLVPGGVAVHTTEVNVIDNTNTVDNNPQTVIFRPRDINKLHKRLLQEGLELSSLKLNFGSTKDDKKISISPEFGNDYSKLQVGGHIITQVVLVIKKPVAGLSSSKKLELKAKESLQYVKNLSNQKKFMLSSKLLKEIVKYNKFGYSKSNIISLKKSYSISLSKDPEFVYLKFKNVSDQPIFGMHDRLHTTKPIVLATTDPNDRPSKFIADDWFNNKPDRPSIYIFSKKVGSSYSKLDYIKPGSVFYYRVKLDGSKVKKGLYKESFIIIQEGVKQFLESKVTIEIYKK